jgi:hypothetical protein
MIRPPSATPLLTPAMVQTFFASTATRRRRFWCTVCSSIRTVPALALAMVVLVGLALALAGVVSRVTPATRAGLDLAAPCMLQICAQVSAAATSLRTQRVASAVQCSYVQGQRRWLLKARPTRRPTSAATLHRAGEGPFTPVVLGSSISKAPRP